MFQTVCLLKNSNNLHFLQRTQLIIWAAMAPNILNSFIGPWLFQGLNDNLLFTSICHPLHRILWALSVCWIIYACAERYATPLNWFLSHSCWKPLVKLNYSVFLVHQAFITLIGRILRTELTFHGFLFTLLGLGTYLAALVISIPIVLVFEMPFLNLEKDVKEFWRRLRVKRDSDKGDSGVELDEKEKIE